MPTLPSASMTIDSNASAFGGGTGYCVVMAPVYKSADSVPRVVASTKSILDTYGYNQGADYAALHFASTRKPLIFIGMSITTAGTIGSQDNTGMVGTSLVTVTADTNGVLDGVVGSVTITTGTAVGTDQIAFDLSCDGGVSKQRVRLGTASSYTIPNLGIVLNFGAGTLAVGDVFKFTTTAPMWGSTAISTARVALAAQQNLARSWMVIGDVPNSTFANYIVTEANSFETSNQRYTYARGSVSERSPLATKSKVNVTMQPTAAATLTFAAAGHTITRSAGSWVTDGFAVGMVVTIAGSVSNNGVTGALTGVSATVLTFGAGIVNEGPTAIAGYTVTASEGITFAAAGFTITRAGGGSWLNDGFAIGQAVTISGTASNNGTTPVISALTATVMTFASGIINEGPSASFGITMVQALTFAQWVSAQTTAFATVDAQKRVDFSLGRGIVQSPITGWSMRRPAAWAASIREYQHDIQIPTYRKADGPLSGWSLTDTNGNIVEFDERIYGGALAGRFTCLRSYGNGPLGAFVALSLTRDSEGSLLSRTHNMAVCNLAETVTQAETENAIGQVLVLNNDGTGTDASLSLIEQRVNSSLQTNLLQAFTEGPRASKAVWSASRTDVLNTAGATLNGVLTLNLNGTIEQIATRVRVQTAGS